ncbi:MAG: MMPL family transporter [Propionibacteriaceae bacterium]
MSSFLYDVGRWCFRRRGRVLIGWLGLLLVVAGTAMAIRQPTSDSFSIPGAPSQTAYDQLRMTFPSAADSTSTFVVTIPDGHSFHDADIQHAIEAGLDGITTRPYVKGVISPYNEYVKGQIATDGRTAKLTVRVVGTATSFTDTDRQSLQADGGKLEALLPAGSKVLVGGEVFSVVLPKITLVEGIGVLVAFIVLIVVLGSLLMGVVPLANAILGVALAMAVTYGATRFMDISSTTPMLGLMLGLAVGIDYALFIMSRHRDQLASSDISPEESTARSVGTAGSAVVFAGLTVIIALVGLAVANVPFLTVMGAFGAVAVAIGVLVALTLLPAVLGFLGERARPKKRRPAKPHKPRTGGGASGWWVRVVTRFPVVTILLVVAGLGALSLPAKDLWLSLPNAGQLQPSSPARQTYDAVAKAFGPGANGTLVVTMTIVQSTDPLGLLNGIKADIEEIDGVASVPMAVPNENADTGMIQVVPTTAPDDPRTEDVVKRIQSHASEWKARYGVDVYVTGLTAVGLDITSQLAGALLPFGIFVVGLSLILLMMVFRSIAVPIKAAVGYLLSIGSAFGATTLVFNQGWFSSVVNLHEKQAIISFFPIITMGILFGLAMDYEVFLVSRMREEHVHGDDARHAVHDGFVHSAKVVVAAALIMFAVFAFFVPNGEGALKAIAFGLAFGVAIDAFLVRMTLVPAVMHLLGEKAWWLPKWLDRILPSLDIEGESLARQLAGADWPTPDDRSSAYGEDIVIGESPALVDGLSLRLDPGQVLAVTGTPTARAALLLTLGGRMAPSAGRLKVLGHVLPDAAGKVRRVSMCADALTPRLATELARTSAQLILIDDVDRLSRADLAAVAALIAQLGTRSLVVGASSLESLSDVLRPGDVTLHLDGENSLVGTRGGTA